MSETFHNPQRVGTRRWDGYVPPVHIVLRKVADYDYVATAQTGNGELTGTGQTEELATKAVQEQIAQLVKDEKL